jgi:uncharacterized membrane protein
VKVSGTKRRAAVWASGATAVAAVALGAGAWFRRLSRHGRSRGDDALELRVLQRLGRVSPRTDALDVLASEGRVELVGRLPADELEAVLDTASRVRGVRLVENHLELDALPGACPLRSIVASASVTVAAPPATVFTLWNRLERLPTILRHMREVHRTSGDRYRFRATAPGGVAHDWEASVTRYVPGALIAWRSHPGGGLDHAGIVRLGRTSRGGTLVAVRLFYGARDEESARSLTTLMGPVPDHDLGADLGRWKELFEAGKLPPGPDATPLPVILPPLPLEQVVGAGLTPDALGRR